LRNSKEGDVGLIKPITLTGILTFYFGIVTFIMAFLAYIILTESLGTVVLMLFVVGLTFVPTSLFMFFRGFTAQKPKVFSTNS